MGVKLGRRRLGKVAEGVRSRVLRKVYWSKKGEAIVHWRKGHCEEFHDAYF